MIKRAVLRFIVGIGVLELTGAAFAGAWTLDANTGAVIITGTAMQAATAFDGNNKIQAGPGYSKEEGQALNEFGVPNWFTALLKPSLPHVDHAATFQAARPRLG